MLGPGPALQIRGRVGQSRERRTAYLFYPSSAALTDEAGQRLATLSDYTELGSGFKIAMRDLEIRGAGNLLGDEQSGHVAAVGFELYVGMLDEAVAALGGDGADEAPEPVRIDVPVDAYVPGDYVPVRGGEDRDPPPRRGRAEIADLILLREELEDRFGPVPGAARQPDQAAGRADQARPGRREGRRLPPGAPGGVADRARLARREGAPRAAARGDLRVRPQHGGRAHPGRGRPRASPGWSLPPRRSSRSPPSPSRPTTTRTAPLSSR